MEIIIKTNNELQEELLTLFDSLDIEGQAEVLATAYREKMRMKGIDLNEEVG